MEFRHLATLRRALGLGVALGVVLPVAALVRFDASTRSVGWILRPVATPDGDWPGQWTGAVLTVAHLETQALNGALAVLLGLAILVWLAALIDGTLGSLRTTVDDRHGWAVRSAVGATRSWLRAEVLGKRLGIVGLACGVGLAGAAVICETIPRFLPRSLELVGPSGAAMLATAPLVPLVVSVTLMVAVGFPLLLLPSALELRRPAAFLGTGRKPGDERRDTGGLRRAWIGDAAWLLAVCQIAACLTIVTCAAFLLRGAPVIPATTGSFPYGRDTLVLRVRIPTDGDRTEHWSAIRDAVSDLDGVRTASVSTPGSLLGLGNIDRVGAECTGCVAGGISSPIRVGLARHMAVDADFFELLGVQVGMDVPLTAAVPGVVIDRTLQGRLLKDQNAYGRHVWLRGTLPLLEPGDIVTGVAEMARVDGLTVNRRSTSGVYAPLVEYPPREADVAFRADPLSTHLADSATAAIAAAAPGSSIRVLGRLEDLIEARGASVRLLARATLLLGAIAFLFGLFGANDAVAERVRDRTWEVGLRRAVGARRSEIVWLVLADGARLVASGALVGTAVGFSLNRGFPLFVDNIEPLSSAAIGALALLLVALLLAAATAAAWRAASLKPGEALRQ